jgi:hypothetical protein
MSAFDPKRYDACNRGIGGQPAYRERAQQLSQIAAHEWREDISARRRYSGADTAALTVLANFPRYQINFSPGPCDGAFNRRFPRFPHFPHFSTRS